MLEQATCLLTDYMTLQSYKNGKSSLNVGSENSKIQSHEMSFKVILEEVNILIGDIFLNKYDQRLRHQNCICIMLFAKRV